MRIGFIILTWNSEKVIMNCIHSICDMSKITSDIVIIDNGSTDNTVSLIEDACRDIDKCSLHVIRNSKNLGTTVSRNLGIKYLTQKKADFYCILDSDTVINESAMFYLTEVLQANPKYAIAGPRMVTSTGVVQNSGRVFPTITEKIFKALPIQSLQKIGERMETVVTNNQNKTHTVDYLMSACWMLRPEVFDKVGLLDEKIFYAPEDAEYCIRVWKAGYQVGFCPEVSIIHEWQRLSKKKLLSKHNYEHIKGLLYTFYKHGYLLSSARLKSSFSDKGNVL